MSHGEKSLGLPTSTGERTTLLLRPLAPGWGPALAQLNDLPALALIRAPAAAR
jgi:hypothetical protein